MSDQADTLRKLMNDQDTAPLSEDESLRVPILSFVDVTTGEARSLIALKLGLLLARYGIRMLLVDADPVCKTAEPNLWRLPASSPVFGRQLTNEGMHRCIRSELRRFSRGIDIVLVDASVESKNEELRFHSPAGFSVVVIAPDSDSMMAGYGVIKTLQQRQGVHRISVIVKQVTDGREGVRAFQRLSQVVTKFLDIHLEYLGHCPQDKRGEILLDLEPGRPFFFSLELIAKRLRTKHLRWAESGEKIGQFLTSGKFTEEPAHFAPGPRPGNIARFWRTLLGPASQR